MLKKGVLILLVLVLSGLFLLQPVRADLGMYKIYLPFTSNGSTVSASDVEYQSVVGLSGVVAAGELSNDRLLVIKINNEYNVSADLYDAWGAYSTIGAWGIHAPAKQLLVTNCVWITITTTDNFVYVFKASAPDGATCVK